MTKKKLARSIVRKILGRKPETGAERQAQADLERLPVAALQNLLSLVKGNKS